MMKSSYNNGEQAVSETVGYIIIFAIMMTGISLITLYGYPALMKEQSSANVKNMENNLIVLQNDINSLVFKSVPYKETTIQVGGGTLSWGNYNQYFVVTDDSGPILPQFKTHELRYINDDGNTILGLENGAVNLYAPAQGGSVMLSKPRWFYDNSTDESVLVLEFINITSSNPVAQTGIGTVRMNITQLGTIDQLVAGNVHITYCSDIAHDNYQTAWKNYLSDSDIFSNFATMTYPGPPAIYHYSEVDRIVIKSYTIDILGL